MLVDIEKIKNEMQKELATHSAQLERDIESYKVSLIADAERIKATQDVKKSLAMRMAERKFNSIFALLDAHLGLLSSVAALVTTDLHADSQVAMGIYAANHANLIARFADYDKCASSAHAFLTSEQIGKLTEHKSLIIDLLSARPTHNDPIVARESAQLQRAIYLSAELEFLIKNLLQAMESVD